MPHPDKVAVTLRAYIVSFIQYFGPAPLCLFYDDKTGPSSAQPSLVVLSGNSQINRFRRNPAANKEFAAKVTSIWDLTAYVVFHDSA